MKAVILAGGFGTRLEEETTRIPKPMVCIGERPILWHIMKIYEAGNINNFLIALGYKEEVIKDYFLKLPYFNHDLSIDFSDGQIKTIEREKSDWKVSLINTGLNTMTGGRILRLRDYLKNDTFCLTYGDGVADIDIQKLIRFHRSHGKLATITAVYPSPRFGMLELDGRQVVDFTEKRMPNVSSEFPDSWQEGLINGGFFVLEPKVIDYIENDNTIWEREPLQRLAKDGQLMAYFHNSFWQPMDSIREVRYLRELWDSGKAPWKIW